LFPGLEVVAIASKKHHLRDQHKEMNRNIMCLTLFVSVYEGASCDFAAMQSCYSEYIAGLTGKAGIGLCDHVNRLALCASCPCEECTSAEDSMLRGALSETELLLQDIKATIALPKAAMCTDANAICPGHAFCSNNMTCQPDVGHNSSDIAVAGGHIGDESGVPRPAIVVIAIVCGLVGLIICVAVACFFFHHYFSSPQAKEASPPLPGPRIAATHCPQPLPVSVDSEIDKCRVAMAAQVLPPEIVFVKPSPRAGSEVSTSASAQHSLEAASSPPNSSRSSRQDGDADNNVWGPLDSCRLRHEGIRILPRRSSASPVRPPQMPAGTSHLRPGSRSRSPGFSASSRASSAHPVTPRGDDHQRHSLSRGSPRTSHLTHPGCVHVDADMV
jgi:hypothetical protein